MKKKAFIVVYYNCGLNRVTTEPGKSWKTAKVMENSGKSWKSHGKVMEKSRIMS